MDEAPTSAAFIWFVVGAAWEGSMVQAEIIAGVVVLVAMIIGFAVLPPMAPASFGILMLLLAIYSGVALLACSA
jgi:hypothetical protein